MRLDWCLGARSTILARVWSDAPDDEVLADVGCLRLHIATSDTLSFSSSLPFKSLKNQSRCRSRIEIMVTISHVIAVGVSSLTSTSLSGRNLQSNQSNSHPSPRANLHHVVKSHMSSVSSPQPAESQATCAPAPFHH